MSVRSVFSPCAVFQSAALADASFVVGRRHVRSACACACWRGEARGKKDKKRCAGQRETEVRNMKEAARGENNSKQNSCEKEITSEASGVCLLRPAPALSRALDRKPPPRERNARHQRETPPTTKNGACSIVFFLTITRFGLQLARIASTALEGDVLPTVEERERRLAVAIEDVTTPSRTETNANQVTGGLRPPLPPTTSPAVPLPPSTCL